MYFKIDSKARLLARGNILFRHSDIYIITPLRQKWYRMYQPMNGVVIIVKGKKVLDIILQRLVQFNYSKMYSTWRCANFK